jgi:hypothetical protein
MGTKLDARLALAEVERGPSKRPRHMLHLAAIEADAKAKSYNLIARKAALARGEVFPIKLASN